MSWDRYQSRDPRRIDPMKTPLYDYVVLDTETTGFKPENGAKLIEPRLPVSQVPMIFPTQHYAQI